MTVDVRHYRQWRKIFSWRSHQGALTKLGWCERTSGTKVFHRKWSKHHEEGELWRIRQRHDEYNFFKKGGKSFAEIILDEKKGNKNRNIYREHPVPSEPKKKHYWLPRGLDEFLQARKLPKILYLSGIYNNCYWYYIYHICGLDHPYISY
jgi:hypothetical protein